MDVTASVCRSCGSPSECLRRIHRHGFLERRIFPLFGLYPWRCEWCSNRHFYRIRTAQQVEAAQKGELAEPVEPVEPVH